MNDAVLGPFPCPCCGHVVFADAPGSYDICPVCNWEDDIVQLRWPDFAGGANRPSLIEAQEAFMRVGAIEQRWVSRVRAARATEPVDPSWRLFDPTMDSIEGRVSGLDYGMTYSDDPTAYYYWVERD